MRNSTGNNKGISMIEALSYIALLGLLLSLIYSIYYQFSRTLSAADRTMLKERSSFDAVRTLQDDIRRSKRVVESFGPFNASDGDLILLAEKRNPLESQVIVYRLARSASSLMRHQLTAEQPWKPSSSHRVGYDVEDFDFSVDGNNTGLLKVSITVKEGPLGILRGRALTFHATMRNGRNDA